MQNRACGQRSALRAEVTEALEAAVRNDAALGDVLEAWRGIVAAGELPTRHLGACVAVGNAGCVKLTGREVAARAGGDVPYFLRGQSFELIDDWSCEGSYVLVGAVGDVSTRYGGLVVVDAPSRFAYSPNFHLVGPLAEGDRAYVMQVLRGVRAAHLMAGAREAPVIRQVELCGTLVPWPDAELRAAFVQVVDACELRGLHDLARRVAHAYVYGQNLAHGLETGDGSVAGGHGACDAFCREAPACGLVEVLEAALQAVDAGTSMLDVVGSTADLAVSDMPHGSPCGLALCLVPPVEGEWTTRRVAEDDPRWRLGVPPRNDAAFAWVQQALACLDERGRALLLVPNRVLHATGGRAGAVREALASSGLVSCVVSLPGGLAGASGAPRSLLVLERGGADRDAVLMADLRGLGRVVGLSDTGWPERVLCEEVVARLMEELGAWLNGEELRDPLFTVVPQADIKTSGWRLTPWTFVR